VIGGSGIYDIPGLENVEEHQLHTPFGATSDSIRSGVLGETRLVFIPRHGRGHRIAPHRINARANICALKMLGAEQVVSLSAVGSMREEIHPGEVVIVDQYIDWTKSRTSTFFDEEVVAHVSFSHPVCAALAKAAAGAVRAAGGSVHEGGTYLCMEGPQFSTLAESLLYRSFGVSVIGMTAMPEAKLAREAELPYATLAFATDYDCWHESEEAVSVEAVLAVLRKNADLAKTAIAKLATMLPDPSSSPASHALDNAVLTREEAMSPRAQERLGWLLSSRDKESE
jgi:5'-methylthioadenosine phosphorylase